MANLKVLLKEQKNKNGGDKLKVSTIAVFLGAKTRTHFPKLRDENGKKLVDPKTGRDLVSEISDGDTYTLSELGTSKIVKLVTIPGLELEVGEAYRVQGLGYDMANTNSYFLDEACSIDQAEESLEV